MAPPPRFIVNDLAPFQALGPMMIWIPGVRVRSVAFPEN